MNGQSKELTKIATREHSLIYFSAWSDADQKDFKENWFDIDVTNLFIGEGKTGKTSVWYLIDDLDMLGDMVAKKIEEDESFFDKIHAVYFDNWNILLPYILKEKEVFSIDEFKSVYNTYVKWWSAMSLLADAGRKSEVLKQKVLEARSQTERYTEEIDKVFMNFLEKKYPQYAEVHWVLLPEEVSILKERALSPEELNSITERLHGYIMFNGKLYKPQKLSQLMNEHHVVFEYIEEVKQEEVHLNGTIACAGKVQGKIRILKYKEEINQFQEGEVLLTEMTTPDFIPAMRKAAAIVTDEGGITSHAAIISRELKKPCIVGTQLATKMFKNGDVVEVDGTGEKGMIKRINAAS